MHQPCIPAPVHPTIPASSPRRATLQATAGFPDHPHRGFETCSIMLSGKIDHADSMGNKGTITDGGWAQPRQGGVPAMRARSCRRGCAGHLRACCTRLMSTRRRAHFAHECCLPACPPSLAAGGVQWMTAGRGVIHSEMPQITQGDLHGFQLWINLPAKVGGGASGHAGGL